MKTVHDICDSHHNNLNTEGEAIPIRSSSLQHAWYSLNKRGSLLHAIMRGGGGGGGGDVGTA